jgi:two-component system, OmpR family, phosphate regulon sensor histidine kinase PhoR
LARAKLYELRTPLTVIRGYLETFTNVSSIDPVWQKAISQMLQQASHMTELIDDLTTLSKLETDNIENTQIPLELKPLLTAVVDVAKEFSNGSHTFSINGAQDVWVIGNEKELHSAFSNLLLNAVSYSPVNKSTPIKAITITVTIDKINRLHLSFTDNGLGIGSQHLPRLTERFYRVDSSRATSTGGTGLGLAIVKHVLLRHEAILDITSELGQGSTFTCIFPSHKLSATTDRTQAHLLN